MVRRSSSTWAESATRLGANAPQATPDSLGPSIIWTPGAQRSRQQQYGSRPACVAEALVGVGVWSPHSGAAKARCDGAAAPLPIADCRLPIANWKWALGEGQLAMGLEWPGVCCEEGMSSIVYRVSGKSGDYIKTAIVPSNHSEEARFGLLDGAIVSFLLLCAGGLLCLLVLS